MIYSRSPSRRVRGGCDYLSIRICQGNLSRKSPDLHDKLPLQIDVLGSGYQIILQYGLWAASFDVKIALRMDDFSILSIIHRYMHTWKRLLVIHSCWPMVSQRSVLHIPVGPYIIYVILLYTIK